MEKEQDWSYSPYISGSEYYSPERRSEIREGARKLRRQYLRYKEAEIMTREMPVSSSGTLILQRLLKRHLGCTEERTQRLRSAVKRI